MIRIVVIGVACVVGTIACGAAAAADDASLGLSLAPLIGTHSEPTFRETVPAIPIPIVQARARVSGAELFVESFPASPAIVEGVGRQPRLSTNLTFLDGVVRGYALGDRLSAGIGGLVYNQATSYEPGGQVDASRVAGARYELGAGLLPNPSVLRLQVDLMPSLRGTIRTTLPFIAHVPDRPETGSQVEVQAIVRHVHGAFEFSYGARYVDYVAKFDRGGGLADRNCGVLPFITLAVHVGA